MNTQVLTPLLEAGPNSVVPVEVSCFAAAQSATSGGRASRHSATPNGARVAPLATTCADTWVGTARVVGKTPGMPNDNIISNSTVTWTYDPSVSNTGYTYYKPSGSFDLAMNSSGGCSFAFSPNTFAIVNDPLNPPRLGIIDNGFTAPTYGFGATQLVNTTVTASCPGKADVVTSMNGFQVWYASGSGPFSAGQTRLTGSSDDGAIAATWDFSRP